MDEGLSVIDLVICLLRCAVDQEKPDVLDTVIQLVTLLHGILTVLPESAQNIQNSLLQLFELWWSRDLPGKEELISLTVPCLIARTLADRSTLSDIKRVWAIRQALCLFNYDDEESSAPLKKLLTTCLIHPRYLGSEDGVRFLAFLFGLQPQLVDALHIQIKQSLPGCSKDEVLAYGEVYFRAWKMASGMYLERIEYGCIQDLMHAAVHVSRVGTFSMAARLRMVLSLFHQEKQAKTDEALCRLYEPILWRAVKVANPYVRANASILLSDAFPLQNPQATVEETDTLLQKQLDILAGLLEDPCSLVRAVTVTGVCHILQIFWETIPSVAVEGLLEKIWSLASDSSSGSVRTSVFSGLSRLLENRLTHTVLEQLLPKLQYHIHDTSQAVRIAFLDLLTAVKTTGTIKFWCIVPTDHLLYRLECDGPPVTHRIMKLLLPYLLPLNKTPDHQIDRCVALLQENRQAARKFYTLAAGQLTVAAASRFVQALCKSLLYLFGECNDGVYLGDDVTVENENVVTGLLEMMAVMSAVLFPRLSKGSRSTAKDRLVQLFSKALPLFLNHLKNGDARTAILVIASYLPLDSVRTISKGCLGVLRDMNCETPISSYGPVIECLTSWGHSKDVLDLISSWLQEAISGHGQLSKSVRRVSVRLVKKAKDRDGENSAPNSMQKNISVSDDITKAELAVQLMSWMMNHHRSKTAALEQRFSLFALISVLRPAINECETKITSCCPATKLSDRCLADAIALYSKLNIHLIPGSSEDENTSDSPLDNISRLLVWVKNVVLPHLCSNCSSEKTSDMVAKTADKGSRKRKLFKKNGNTLNNDVDELTNKEAAHKLAADLTETVLVIGIEVVTLGLASHDFCQVLMDFSVQLMQTQLGGQFLPQLCKLLYQFSEVRLTSSEDIDSSPVNEIEDSPDLACVFLQHLLRLMTREINNPNRNILQIFSTAKPAIVECLVSSHQHYMTSSSPCLPSLTPMATVMMAIVVDISQTLSDDTEQLCSSMDDLPPLSIFLLSMVNHIGRLREFFLMQLSHAICQEAFQTIIHVIAILNILAVLSSGRLRHSGLLEAVSSVESQLKKDSFRGRSGADRATRVMKLLRTQLS